MATDTGTSAARTLQDQPKTFGLASMTLFAVSAILVLDTTASAAAVGVQGLTWWIIAAVLFFIPYGFITAELGSAWPQEGGIYVWVREAFGPRVGGLTAFLYWINVGYWAPAVFVIFAGTLAAAFWADMSRGAEVAMVLALIWITVGIGILPMRLSKWVPNASAAAKILLFLVLGVGGVVFAVRNGLANPFGAVEWVPSWGEGYSYLVIIFYSYMGFELMSSAGGAIRDPRRDVPRMILLTAVIALVLYFFATFGILATLSLEELSIVSGIADALRVVVSDGLGVGAWLFNLLVVLLLFTFFGNMVTWSIGGNQSLAATGLDKAAPGLFGHVNRRFGTPDYAFLLFGTVASALTLVNYLAFGENEAIFWTIFALSSIVFLVPYLLMFPAYLVLRVRRSDVDRPYVVPGGGIGAWVAALLCEAVIVFMLVLFILEVPEDTPRATYWGITLGGTLGTLLVGWLLSGRSRAPITDGAE